MTDVKREMTDVKCEMKDVRCEILSLLVSLFSSHLSLLSFLVSPICVLFDKKLTALSNHTPFTNYLIPSFCFSAEHHRSDTVERSVARMKHQGETVEAQN